MQKSLFGKYYAVCVAIILFSLVILGLMLMMFADQYFRSERYQLLEQNVQSAVNLTLNDYLDHGGEYVSESLIKAGYTIFGQAIEADLYLTDVSGRTLYCTESNIGVCVHQEALISTDVMAQAITGTYRETGTLGGLYRELRFTVASPIVAPDGTVKGVVFASSSAQALNIFLKEIFRMFLISSSVVLLASAIIIYFVTRSLVRPLRQMAGVAESFGKGDLSKRVPVEGSDEMARLAMSFNNMASGLSTLENARRSFVANVSHELKTPMTTIGGFVDGILDGTIPPEKQDQYLVIVSDEIKRLSRLVWSMLNISRIEAGETTIAPVDFNIVDTIGQTLFNFEHLIEQKNVEVRGLDAVDKVMVKADPDLIHQVVYNLIDNAAKFVNEGGYIGFSFEAKGGVTAFSIRNSGSGISKEEIRRVFEKFYKTDQSRGLDKRGVGLGLYIVRTIVMLHGGDIIVRSAQGEYCEFTVSLPTGRPATQAFRKITDAPNGGSAM